MARLKAAYRNGEAHTANGEKSLDSTIQRADPGVWTVSMMMSTVNSSMTGTTIELTVKIAFMPLRSSRKQPAIVSSNPD